MISKSTIKSRLHEYLKSHRSLGDWYQEFEYVPYLNDKVVKYPKFNKENWLKEYEEWIDNFESIGGTFIMQPADGVFIDDDIESKLKSQTSRLLRRPTAKDKPFVVQFKWNSQEDFNKYKIWGDKFSENWMNRRFGKRYSTKKSAIQSIHAESKKTSFFDHFSGRQWRVLDTKTGEITNFNQ